jgi:hypothetical protein
MLARKLNSINVWRKKMIVEIVYSMKMTCEKANRFFTLANHSLEQTRDSAGFA